MVLGLLGLDKIDEAIALNVDNISHCRKTGDRYMEAECVRLHGELALNGSSPDTKTAEQLFRESLTIAKAHNAKSWELRGAISLARLLQSRHHCEQAMACLKPVLDWFTEGLDTADLQEAKALIRSLA